MKHEKGFTLIELVIAVMVCVIAVLSVLGANTVVQRNTDVQFQRATAMQDAHRIIERMRTASLNGAFPANVVTNFPNGAAVAGFANLTNEQITVAYVNTLTDPLDVRVTVSWLENGLRPASITMDSLMTQRE